MPTPDPPRPSEAELKEPPAELPEPGVLLGYSLEHEHRTAPIGFTYGTGSPRHDIDGSSPTLDPILHTGGGHLMTIAPTGAGKGVSCIIPSLLRFPGPVIVVDPKGENYAVTAARRRALGQRVVVLDPMGITGAPEGGSLNPLDLVDADDAQSIDDSAALAALLSGGLEKNDPSNVFWYQRGDQLLTAVMQFVAVSRPPEHRNLFEVRRILNLPTEDFLKLARTEMARCPDSDVQQTAGMVSNPAEETVGSILAMSQNSVGFLRGELLHESTATSSFELADITAGEPLSIFIVIPPDKLESHRNLLRVWIGALMSALMRRRAPVPHPTLLVLDEAAQLGPLDQLRQAVTLMRGYGLQTWSFWQDVSQLRNLYPRDWETMYNNCRVHQAFGFTTLKSAEATCDLLGFYDALQALQLDSDEMILAVSGDEAVIAQKPNYLTDPGFRGTYSPNPFYTKDADAPPRPKRPRRVYVRPAPETPRVGRSSPPTPSSRDTRAGSAAETPVADEDSDGAAGSEASAEDPGFDFETLLEAAEIEDFDEPEVRTPVSAFLPLPGAQVGFAFEVGDLVEAVKDKLQGAWNPITTQLWRLATPFYGRRSGLYELFDPEHTPRRSWAYQHRDTVVAFDPRGSGVERLNARAGCAVTDDTVADYVRFYFHFTRIRGANARVVETEAQLRYWIDGGADPTTELTPLAVEKSGEGWIVRSTVVRDSALEHMSARVEPSGAVSDVVFTPIDTGTDSIAVTAYPMVGLDGEATDPATAQLLAEVHGRWEVVGQRERRLILDDFAEHIRIKVPDAYPIFRRRMRCYPKRDLLSVPVMHAELEHRGYFHRPGRREVLAKGTRVPALYAEELRLETSVDAEEFLRFWAWRRSVGDSYSLFLDDIEWLPADESFDFSSELERLAEVWTPLVETTFDPEVEPDNAVATFLGMILMDGRVGPREFLVLADGEVRLAKWRTPSFDVAVDRARLDQILQLPALGPARREAATQTPDPPSEEGP